MNDLLLSMVVEDLGGGAVSTASCPSQTPVAQTLKTFSINLAANPTLGQLLNQVRGERVEVEAPNKIVGTILGVHTRKKQVGEREFIETETLDLLTADGLRSIGLDAASRIKLLNESLDAELRRALAVLATANATEKKTVNLEFLGKGRRQVRIGYLQEMPVWRTSYRLVLDEKKSPWLQGWALVENTTENDWKDVALTLVSGQPISFKMDLYQPLFVPRPEVQLPNYASLRPQMYGEAMEQRREAVNRLRLERGAMAIPPGRGRDRGRWALAGLEGAPWRLRPFRWPGTCSRACKRPPAQAPSGSFSNTPSPRPSPCLGRNRRCCRSSIARSRARNWRSTTSRCKPSIP